MKKLLLAFGALMLVFFSSCRHEDFDLLRHPIHVQGGANIHLGTPIGSGEMSIDDLFDMINDSTINSLMDSTSNVITLQFETSIDTTISANGMNINFKKNVGGMTCKGLPWGQNKVNRSWKPQRRSNDHKWTPRRTGRVLAAENGAYTKAGKSTNTYGDAKTGTPDNIYSHTDTVSYTMDLDMLTESEFFADADFELNTVNLSYSMILQVECEDSVRHYLDDYITLTIDSLMIFYTTEDGIQEYPLAMAPNVYGHDSWDGLGITQYPLTFADTTINIASIINEKPSQIRLRFRYTIDVARSMVLDVVARPEFDTTGFYLTGFDLNTVNLNEVSDMDTSVLMNNIRENLANIDTLATINYLFNSNIDTTDPQTILDFFNLDTAAVLEILEIDTNQPRTILLAVGYTDTSDIALGTAAGLPMSPDGTSFDTCELLVRATDIDDCTDTIGLIAAITNDSGVVNNHIDTNYFIGIITGNPNLTQDSILAILAWSGIDTSEANMPTLLLEAGIDTSDHEGLMDSIFGRHLGEGATTADTNWFISQASNNTVNSITDTMGIINAATNGQGITITGSDTTINTDYFVNLAFPGHTGHNPGDTNYFLQQITGNPTITTDSTEALLTAAGVSTDTADIATAAGIPGFTTNPPDTAQIAAHFGLPYYSDPTQIDLADYGYTTADLATMTPAEILDTANAIQERMRQRVADSIVVVVEAYVEDTVTSYIENALTDYIEQPVADAMEEKMTDWFSNTLTPFLEDHVATYVEEKLTDYLEDEVVSAVSEGIQENIIPRIENYVIDEVTDYVTRKVIQAFQDTILNYLENRVYDYVYTRINDTINDYLTERIENFTSLKDTLESIMEKVQTSDFHCTASAAINLPFEMKINSLEYPLDLELWKNGQEPLDIDSILQSLPNFLNAELDDSYLNLQFANGMPLEFLVHATLLDENKIPTATLIDSDTIKAAQLVQSETDPTCWEAGDSTISVVRAMVNTEKLRQLRDAKYIRMGLTLSTNNRIVYVKRSDKLGFRAFLQANANANIDVPIIDNPNGLPIPNIF